MKTSTVTATALAAAMLQSACAQDLDLAPIELKAPDLARSESLMQAFAKRASSLSVEDKMLSLQDLSDLLWAGNGVNRPEEKKRTAPSAVNAQDVDIYVFLAEGAYLYDAFGNVLKPVAKGDFRDAVIAPSRMNAGTPPVLLMLVCDVSRFTMIKDEATRVRLAAMDAGIVSQNIALFCAGTGMATRPRASNNAEKLKEVLKLSDTQIPMLNHPVGYEKAADAK